jgi:hypothetical protein
MPRVRTPNGVPPGIGDISLALHHKGDCSSFFRRYEPERETLKYRRPAKYEGWECPVSAVCNAGNSYGKTVRVPREEDLQRFPGLPRATKNFERM